MMRIVLLKVCLFHFGLSYVYSMNPIYFNIGGVLSNNESITHFKEIIAVSKFLLLIQQATILIWNCVASFYFVIL